MIIHFAAMKDDQRIDGVFRLGRNDLAASNVNLQSEMK